MKLKLTVALSLVCAACFGQVPSHRVLRGDFSQDDSIHIVNSYQLAQQAVEHMYTAMITIWDVQPQAGHSNSNRSKMTLRAERWRNDETFMKWLGEPSHMKLVARTIRKIHRKFDRKFTLEVVKADEGRCNRFVGE